MREALRSPWLRLPLVVAGIVLIGWCFAQVAGVLTPFAIAFTLAYFLNPVVNATERGFARRLEKRTRLRERLDPRTLAVGVLCLLAVATIVIVVALVVPAAWRQAAEAGAKLPEYAQRAREKLEPIYERLNLRYPDQAEEIRARLETTLRENALDIVKPLTHGIQAAFSSVLGFVLSILNLLIVPVFAVYLLYDMNRINAGLRELVPHRFRPYVYSRLAEVDRLLSAFVRGQITVCLLLGSFYAVGLTGCGVPMGLLVGFLVGFFNLIPFMSYILGLPLALVLSWVDDQSSARLLAVAAVFTFGQFVEGNFITPRIVGERLGLHAVVIMLAVLVGGTLFGFLGMLLAVPTTAALSVFWADLKELYVKSDFYGRGAPSPSA